MRVRRLAALAPIALLTAGVVIPAGTANAAPKAEGLRLLVPALAPMTPGQQGWVSAVWGARQDVCDVSVTASGPGVSITYPLNTGGFSSFHKSANLAKGAADFTALRIVVDPTVRGPVPVKLTATYTQLPDGKAKDGKDGKDGNNDNDDNDDDKLTSQKNLSASPQKCDGPKVTSTSMAVLPIFKATGPQLVQQTKAVTVDRGAPSWANVEFSTAHPGLDDFRVAVTPPAGLSVVYPGDKPSAGLLNSNGLLVGQKDYVSVRFDAAGLAPGSYELPVKATWTGGSYVGAVTLTVR